MKNKWIQYAALVLIVFGFITASSFSIQTEAQKSEAQSKEQGKEIQKKHQGDKLEGV